jgi:hypothetical protein
MRTLGLAVFAALVLANVAPANGQALFGLTEAYLSTGTGLGTDFASAGGAGETSTTLTLPRGDSALAEASSSLNSNGYIPTLRTRATASPTRANAVAVGVQGYRNNSGAIINTTLSLDLSATITGGNDIGASVYLFKTAGFEYYADSGTILFESSSELWDGVEPFANNLGPEGFDIDIKNFSGTVDEQRTFDFSIAPGESFYVWARLETEADNPGVADAYSTLTATLSNTEGLAPALVPEPDVALLFLIGGGMAFFARRCR